MVRIISKTKTKPSNASIATRFSATKQEQFLKTQKYIKNFINTQQDFAYNNNNNVIDAYCKYVNITKEELLQKLETNKSYIEKLTLFISNFNKKCVISTYKNKKNKATLLRGAERVCATNEVRSEIQTARAWPRAAQQKISKKV